MTNATRHFVRRPRYDVVVVGAGAMGSAAAYHCARDGRHVLLLEQFTVGHSRGSSHGESRIIRYTHDAVDYASQMPATFALWRELERESGAPLMQLTGGLYLGPAAEPWLVQAQQTLTRLDMPYRLLDAHDLARAYPQFCPHPDWIGLEQEHTGMLAASRCVATLVSQAVRHGATVREETPVAAVMPDGDGVRLRLTTGEEILADRAVLAAGPWAGRFLAGLVGHPVPLRVTHQQVAYFRSHDSAAFAIGRFPIFILVSHPHFYGFPIWERRGEVKLALEQSVAEVDPDAARTADPGLLEELVTGVAAVLPGLDPHPVEVVPCLYTETPTRDFVIDRHPDHPQIVIAAGFSGRGFKHAVAVGRLLADLVATPPGDYRSPFWRDVYRLARFATH
jgi:sarcosine oxidase